MRPTRSTCSSSFRIRTSSDWRSFAPLPLLLPPPGSRGGSAAVCPSYLRLCCSARVLHISQRCIHQSTTHTPPARARALSLVRRSPPTPASSQPATAERGRLPSSARRPPAAARRFGTPPPPPPPAPSHRLPPRPSHGLSRARPRGNAPPPPPPAPYPPPKRPLYPWCSPPLERASPSARRSRLDRELREVLHEDFERNIVRRDHLTAKRVGRVVRHARVEARAMTKRASDLCWSQVMYRGTGKRESRMI